MKVLVINSGSSTIKYRVVRTGEGSIPASGILERIGEGESVLRHRRAGPDGRVEESVRPGRVADHREGFDLIMGRLAEDGDLDDPGELHAVGHRVVHGGERFVEPVLVDDAVIAGIRDLVPLAPLHNPGNLLGIEAARRLWPDLPQVAVFDTAFHHTLPPPAYHYAIPPEWHDGHRVRRYGFHGTAVSWVVREAARLLGRPASETNMIVLHLGNGASATAVRNGRSVDTSMGLTPLEGLVMGTRSGDIDPAVLLYMRRQTGKLVDDLESLLNHGSGLKGLCGTNDMREILARVAAGDEAAALAVDVYCHRARKYVGAYAAVLGRLDALVFSGGIGENAAPVRRSICGDLGILGITLDDARNEAPGSAARDIGREGSPVRVLVVPAGEELEIARLTLELVGRRG